MIRSVLDARSLGASVYRGDLDNVAARFFTCLHEYPCDSFIRLSGADSPVLDATVLKTIVGDYRGTVGPGSCDECAPENVSQRTQCRNGTG